MVTIAWVISAPNRWPHIAQLCLPNRIEDVPRRNMYESSDGGEEKEKYYQSLPKKLEFEWFTHFEKPSLIGGFFA